MPTAAAAAWPASEGEPAGLERLVPFPVHPSPAVLLDIGLPDIEGFEVAQALSDDGPPPLVVLTSSRDARAYGRRLTSGRFLGFIPKERISGAAIRALVDRS